MDVKNIAFRGNMPISGTQTQLKEINDIILRQSLVLKKGEKLHKEFDYDSIVIDGKPYTSELTVLYTTKEDTTSLYRFMAAAKKQKALSSTEEFKEFYTKNIANFINVAEPRKAEDVLRALNLKIIDIPNLLFHP